MCEVFIMNNIIFLKKVDSYDDILNKTKYKIPIFFKKMIFYIKINSIRSCMQICFQDC